MAENTTTQAADAPTLDEVLLGARGTVYLPTDVPTCGKVLADRQAEVNALREAGVTLLEADLAERGYLMSPGLRGALTAVNGNALRTIGLRLLAQVDAATGADRTHTPMFRGFPHSTPRDTFGLFAARVIAALLQSPDQPCVLCGTVGSVVTMSPCGHLACARCFPPENHAACPVCYNRLDEDHPYFTAGQLADGGRVKSASDVDVPARLRVLTLGRNRHTDAVDYLTTLLGRPASLTGTEALAFDVLLDEALTEHPAVWVPAQVPGRATKARLLAGLLTHAVTTSAPGSREDAIDDVFVVIHQMIDTATDVLRLAAVYSGGSPELTEAVRFVSMPRPVRRSVLDVLERLCIDGKQESVVADMVRHRGRWKRLAEILHPFEHAGSHPAAAACFAMVRVTRPSKVTGPVAAALDTSGPAPRGVLAEHLTVDVAGDRVRFASWTGRVEAALAAGDVSGAVELLESRPGDLGRRLDHLLRLATASSHADSELDRVVAGVAKAAPGISTAVLLAAVGTVRTHFVTSPARTRLFFPKGGAARGHVAVDERGYIDAEARRRVVEILTGELVRRAGALPAVESAVVDAALFSVPAPFAARSASAALVQVPRASVLPLPDGKKMRLFVHWMESGERVDLDLSVAFFDAAWNHVGTCDYTSLRFGEAATHSGDYTSAPAPAGAAEFIDLDISEAAGRGVRYAVASVYSYNSVAFDDMAEAFAGVMMLPDDYDLGTLAGVASEESGFGHGYGRHVQRPRRVNTFDARAVEQRFDLSGKHKAHLPLMVDVVDRTWTWLDTAAGVSGEVHAVWNTDRTLAATGRAYADLTSWRSRVSLGEVAAAHAAGRAALVTLRRTDGTRVSMVRGKGEDQVAFAARIRDVALAADAPAGLGESGGVPELAFVLTGDLEVADGAQVYALYPRALDANRVTLLAAGDVAGLLDSAISHAANFGDGSSGRR